MRTLAKRSIEASLVMICAEDELLHNENTRLIQRCFKQCVDFLAVLMRHVQLAECADSQSVFALMIASFNLNRFKMGSWASFVLDSLGSSRGCVNTAERVINPWMRNKGLFEHSDLVVFTREGPCTLLLASEFSTRPLGKPLPPIEMVCHCAVSATSQRQKVWLVQHNARHECAVRDVKLSVKCSFCKKTWLLETAWLNGVIYVHDGRCCVKVIADIDNGWHHD
jgi:hypothetical protein